MPTFRFKLIHMHNVICKASVLLLRKHLGHVRMCKSTINYPYNKNVAFNFQRKVNVLSITRLLALHHILHTTSIIKFQVYFCVLPPKNTQNITILGKIFQCCFDLYDLYMTYLLNVLFCAFINGIFFWFVPILGVFIFTFLCITRLITCSI